MKKFDPVTKVKELVEFQKLHKAISWTTWLRKSQGLKVIPYLLALYPSVDISQWKSEQISKYHKDPADLEYKGKFLKITFRKRY